MRKTEMKIKELKETLGIILHTAFRKGCDDPQAAIIWKAIDKLHPDQWDSYLEWVISALKECGVFNRKRRLS